MVETSQRLSAFCLINDALTSGLARLFGPSLSLAIALLVGLTDSTLAQDAPQKRVSQKVAVQPAVPIRLTKGQTYVALAGGLEQVERGVAPNTLLELKLLEKQQARVASKIDEVTVNVQQNSAQGSGVIITPDGYVLTAAHVAGGKDRQATIILNDGTRIRATTLGMNRNKDAGLLKIDPGQRKGPWPYATLGKSSELSQGQWVIAAGHPGGWDSGRGSVVRVGRVLKIQKTADSTGKRTPHTLTTDCALIGGDSGGPLFTLTGELIGVHSRIGTDVEENMHVPIDVFGDSWERMAIKKEVWGSLPGFQPVIGVRGPSDTKLPMIESVVEGGPAHRAGIDKGDLVVSVDGNKVSTFLQLQMAVEAKSPGDTLLLKVRRGNEFYNIPVIVGVKDN